MEGRTSSGTSCKKSARLLLCSKLLIIFFVLFLFNVYISPRRFLQSYHNVITDYRFSSLENNHLIGRVFIAINLYQSQSLLEDGSWTCTLMELIDQLGPNNVYLSIFENNSTDATPHLLRQIEKQLKCEHTIVTTTINLDEDQYASLYINDRKGKYLSRMAYLAMVRNRALEPIMSNGRFSKVLFLNDIVFSSQDVIQLLQTNSGNYAAACALDFINPVKFYDTFATRDSSGYSMGLPLYPYFSPGQSQSQTLRNSLIHVKSCWSGMVAFDSKPFDNGLKFRSLDNVSDYDASECCLIHADINQPNRTFINPRIHVAYSKFVYIWHKRLAYFESIWKPVQRVITYLANLPRYNKFRLNGIHPSERLPFKERLCQAFRDHLVYNPEDLPPKTDLREQMTPVEDQSRIGSCSANCLAGAYEYLTKRGSHQNIDISSLFIYYNGRVKENGSENAITDSGCSMTRIIEALEEYGTCLESLWPSDITQVNEQPSDEAYQQAKHHKITDALQINIDLYEMKSCLAQGFPFAFGLKFFSSFDQAAQSGIVPMPNSSDRTRQSDGSHALLAVGYNDQSQSFIVRNSWGEDWGDKSYCYIPYDYITDSNLCFDVWTVRKVATDDFGQDHWDTDDSVDY
ncbi:unnamed protein product [Adineta ricciae]|uniref:Peptidase C1A papain C-terminal domain-containing protein n=1 Tax=Adineta ricciae TaxID=249248 RepID=A0A814XZ91_ADIRI|nr:unnamed protein product [Adineta ricciae]